MSEKCERCSEGREGSLLPRRLFEKINPRIFVASWKLAGWRPVQASTQTLCS